jgi:hypothetical protein
MDTSFYVHFYTAFFLSRIIHWPGDDMLLGNGSGGKLHFFFMLQAVAIMCEDSRIAFASNIVGFEGRWWKLFSYLWVLMWFAYSMLAWMGPMIKGGMDETGQRYDLFRRVWQALGMWNDM